MDLPADLARLLPADVPPRLEAALSLAWTSAPFLKGLIRNRRETLARIVADGPDAALAAIESGTTDTSLRAAKADLALVIALADLAGDWSLEQVTAALSDFADRAIDTAIAAALAERGGPNAGFVAIALGKLGSHELNYSSDVDLILLYDPDVIPVRPREDPAEAAVRIARRVVATMQAPTPDGYVFRVDLRLRPSSEITPIALPVAAAEHYYQSEAETWERTAFIRARACAGDIALGQAFLAAIRPFVWRRHLDYTAIRDIKSVSLRIRDHFDGGQAVGAKFDLKRGRGGIREIEFFAQIHQLVWGGRDPMLRAPATLDALTALAAAGRIDGDDAAMLADAYRFLRTIEHRLQMRADEQTHAIPATAAHRRDVARLSGFAEWGGLETRLGEITGPVAGLYDRLIADSATPRLPEGKPALARALAARPGAKALAPMIARWRSANYRALRGEAARRDFEALLPALADTLGTAADPAQAAARFDSFLGALPSGVQFFALLAANPALLPLLGRLLGIAPVLADALARRPALFDALLLEDSFAPLAGVEALTGELARLVSGAAVEETLDRVRDWTADRRFQLGAQLIEGAEPGRVAADLADLADAAVIVTARCVRADFAARHGMVPGGRLVVLGFGRYGGRALTHASDLDLVYLFTGSHEAVSDGAKPLPATIWFQRAAARLTAALSAPTASGALYDIDTRLRPSGAKGLLAVSVDSFRRYEEVDAETWEHMALTRARVVDAEPEHRAAIEAVIAAVLDRPRNPVTLRADVLAMRREVDLAKPGGGLWDVKLGPGGLVDIEFMVQYLQLRERTALTPDLGAACRALATAGLVPDDLPDAHDRLARLLSLLRLVGGSGPFSPAVQAMLARGCDDFADAEAALGLAKARVRAAWTIVFGTKRQERT